MTPLQSLSTRLVLLLLSSVLLGQSAWNTGDISFNYQRFPFPAESFDLSGDLLADEVPHEGVGGFELGVGDTNLVTLLSYDLYESEGDTLADIFVIFMQDTLPITEGTYTVNPVPGALKLFVWLKEVDPESLTDLIDASFTLDSLDSFDPSISVAGAFEIISVDDFHLEMSFSGSMVNTSFQVVNVTDGHIEVWNSLPVTAYTEGVVSYAMGAESGNIDGSLNPFEGSEGAGAVLTQDNDTLTYNFISYIELSDGNYNVFGVMLVGEEEHFPLDGSESQFDVSLLDGSLPGAVPYMMLGVSVDEIIQVLESGTVPDLDQLTQLYLPIGLGSVVFSYSSEGNAELDMSSILMSNSAADIVALTMFWSLSNTLTLSLDDGMIQTPMGYAIVGEAYPNPFNSSTIIPVHLPSGGAVQGQIYNLRGQKVKDLDFKYLDPGSHQLSLSLRNSNLSGGIYYFALFSDQGPLGSGSIVYLK